MKWLVLGTLCLVWSRQPRSAERRVRGGGGGGGGTVRGAVGEGGHYTQYLGIPYAHTDSNHRFQGPQPLPPWEGVFEAINEHVRCPQRFTSTLLLGQEDCLTLNVYTPMETTGPLPVMVFFHGGGFREGSGSPFLYGPEYFISKGVVLVTVNYRLEILGFLCLGIKEAPGNAGMKDQVEALKWIQMNIKVFGGDPDNVTIFGESAGAAAVSYHTLSPMSKGLFHKAIMQSGSAITPWSFQYDPVITASKLAVQMGFDDTKDPYELYKIFINKTAEDLLYTRVPREEGNIILSETLFVPCLEKDIPGVERFLPDYPYNILSKGDFNKVPMIIGYNSAEGFMFAGKENDTTISKLDFFTSMPRDLTFPNATEKHKAADKATEMYMGDEKVSKSNLAKVARFHGEPFFKYPVIATIDLMLKSSDLPMFNYRFSHEGWLNVAKFIFGFGMEPGATHADELFYMFKTKFPVLWILETVMVERMTGFWTNFAKFGDPTPTVTSSTPTRWVPTDRSNPRILVIDKELTTAPLWDNDATKFWHQTYTKYRRKA